MSRPQPAGEGLRLENMQAIGYSATTRYTRYDRYFGRCPISGCSTRRVVDGAYVGRGDETVPIHYNGHNAAGLLAAGLNCPVHRKFLKFTALEGRVNDAKECNGVCMAAVGPSCDCSCGGENHGSNHVSI